MELVKKIINKYYNGSNEELNKIMQIIQHYKQSDMFKSQEKSRDYYMGKHDILYRKQYGLNADGEKQLLVHKPNSRIVDNLYQTILDQKVNYLFSKEPSIVTENEKYLELVTEIFDNKFFKQWYYVGADVYKYGTAFMYVYVDKEGNLKFKKLNSLECIPIWKDNDHDELDKLIRVYKRESYLDNVEDTYIVEVYDINGITTYNLKNNKLELLSSDIQDYLTINGQGYKWGKIPIITFRANELETPLLNRVKTLQDAINEIYSDFKNATEESTYNTVLVIKGYNDVNNSFRYNLNKLGYIPVGTDGAVETLDLQVNHNNYEIIIHLLKKAMYENAKGFDSKNDRVGANPNQMNIQSMYSDIDLDSNATEREFKDSFINLIYFVDKYLSVKGKGNYEKEKISFLFNKDIMINESQAIDDCLKSANIISRKTLLENHPFVSDVDVELKRIKEDMSNMEYNPFENGNSAYVSYDYDTTRPKSNDKSTKKEKEDEKE